MNMFKFDNMGKAEAKPTEPEIEASNGVAEDVSHETEAPTRPQRRVVPYKADGQLYEDEVPDQNDPEYDTWIKDKLAGWRGKRKERGFDDPGLVREVISAGVKAGIESTRPPEASVADDPFKLLTQRQREQYAGLIEQVSDPEAFKFLTELALENRNAQFMNYENNKALEKKIGDLTVSAGAHQELKQIARMDPDFPDPDMDKDAAWDELKKPGGYLEWLQETGVTGSVKQTYKYYLSDTGKDAKKREKATEVAKPPEPKSSDSTMKKIADTMGNVSGGGAAIGREADETEIRQCLRAEGVRIAKQKYGDRAIQVFNKQRNLDSIKR